MMKLRSSIFAGAAALLFSFAPIKNGDLRDITKPYLGTYDCVSAEWGQENALSQFDNLSIELKDRGEYVLYYREKGGKTKKLKGKYRYVKKDNAITLYLPNSRFIHRAFPIEKGVLTVSVPYGDKTLRLVFQQR